MNHSQGFLLFFGIGTLWGPGPKQIWEPGLQGTLQTRNIGPLGSLQGFKNL